MTLYEIPYYNGNRVVYGEGERNRERDGERERETVLVSK